MPYQYEPFELQVLGDFLHTGAQAAGATWRPTAQSGSAELDSHQVGEVVFIELIPPVTGAGVAEALEQIKLVLDDRDYGAYVHALGTETFNAFPPKTNAINGQILAFGTPLINAVKGRAPLLEGICPKFSKSVKVETTAGSGGITANYRMRLWGYRYPEQELSRLFGAIGGPLAVSDERTNRMLNAYKNPVTVAWETWTQLPGGLDQAMPKINPLIRYARNAVATTANTAYQFRYETGMVTLREENLYFPYDIEDKALLVKGLGVRAPANLLSTFLNIDGKDRPDNRFPTTQFLNDLHYGKGTPLLPADLALFYTIPKLDRPYLIWKDKGYVAVVDDGNVVAIGGITIALNGILIEMS